MKYFLVPELFWLLIFSIAVNIYKSNISPAFAWDDFIDKSWFYIPAQAVLTFGLFWVPGVEKDWLLLRIWVACLLGGHFVLDRLMNAYSKQGPGAGMGYLAGLMFVFILLCIGV